MRLRVRTRLTLRYTGVFVAVLAVYVAAVFLFQYAQLREQIYRAEVQETEAVEGLLYFGNDGQLHLHDEYYSHPQSRLLVNRLLEVHNAKGDLLLRSQSLFGHELGHPTYPREGVGWFERRDAELSDGRKVLFASHLHPLNGQPILIRLGYDLGPLHATMLRFSYLLLLALPPSVLLAAGAGYRLSRAAFAPLQDMAARAEQITAENLGERLAIPPPGDDELGRMAGVVNQLLERLDQSFQRMRRFTADVAHELRTPLASLRASGEEALMVAPDAQHADLSAVISTMLEESERLTQTINGLLLLSRADNESAPLELTTFDLPELVQEVALLLDVLLEERSLRVDIEVLNDGSKLVRADRMLLRSALLNVLHNAVKYSPEGTRIHVQHAHVHKHGLPMQQVCIEDQGPGIAAGEHTRIFERFYRGTIQASGPSIGLGLAIAKMAVEHSGGHIFADETHVGGLRCCLLLPVAGDNAPSMEHP
ncbi:ATP-binding protein [Acidipila sp. EB88]|uniref:ATP-binding protein n=1 Tax=Acidipila sp. EB88 TaxID=2305226 RepID=UPI000F5E9985|nr:ATP-binding protein [Acidipila sp. EB88]RRA49155.1 HAMP domain-containing protein [Acidipila sp. EB88]